MLAGSLPGWAAVSCARYETLRSLPPAFQQSGRGTLERRIGEPGTSGLTDIVQFSDARCDCSNMPLIDRDRGRPVPNGKFWDCSAAKTGALLPAHVKDAEVIGGAIAAPSHAKGFLGELRDWERAAPVSQASSDSPNASERRDFKVCKDSQTPCATQLVDQGWRIVSSGVEPLGVDIALIINLLRQGDQHKLCTTLISHDGVGHERPCSAMTANFHPVKD
jgi:hypothetical protein